MVQAVARANPAALANSCQSHGGSWQFMEQASVSFGVSNLFEEDPPVVGNEAADTGSNSGNTFPQLYDALGRLYSVGLRVSF